MNVYFGGGGPILLDELCCTGTESSLLECSHAGVGIHRCTTSNAAAVQCTGRVMLTYNRTLHLAYAPSMTPVSCL